MDGNKAWLDCDNYAALNMYVEVFLSKATNLLSLQKMPHINFQLKLVLYNY